MICTRNNYINTEKVICHQTVGIQLQPMSTMPVSPMYLYPNSQRYSRQTLAGCAANCTHCIYCTIGSNTDFSTQLFVLFATLELKGSDFQLIITRTVCNAMMNTTCGLEYVYWCTQTWVKSWTHTVEHWSLLSSDIIIVVMIHNDRVEFLGQMLYLYCTVYEVCLTQYIPLIIYTCCIAL